MRYLIIAIFLTTLLFACSEQTEVLDTSTKTNNIVDIKEFVIPGSININKNQVIAAYYEHHPKEACVIIAYNDTTKTTFKKYSYSMDSSLVMEDLVSRYYNEYKLKNDTCQTFIIKPASVVYMKTGSNSISAEFERIDLLNK